VLLGGTFLNRKARRSRRRGPREAGAAAAFLFGPTTQLAAISVLLLGDRGATNQAAAFSCAIMAIVIATLLAAHLLLRLLGARNVALVR
jgi:iron(III) transport system permease protein